jgi:16S rRNA (guanine966-N2)-methyltransferase
MRVVAGRFGGRRLTAPPGRATRPTADRVREALFSILGPLDGLRVLDLFAGSGALGIEALSRGARHGVFVERSARAAAAISANLAALGIEATVVRGDALAFLRASAAAPRAGAAEPFDLAFLDPPYSSAPGSASSLAELLPPVLFSHARIVTESDKRAPLELPLTLETERVYGDTRIAVHRGP